MLWFAKLGLTRGKVTEPIPPPLPHLFCVAGRDQTLNPQFAAFFAPLERRISDLFPVLVLNFKGDGAPFTLQRFYCVCDGNQVSPP